MDGKRPSDEAVEMHLTQVKAHPLFDSSPKATSLLEYLVGLWIRRTLDNVTEFSIGVDHLGKPSNWNPKTGEGTKRKKPDSTVRVAMRNLRDRLTRLYADWGTPPDGITISFEAHSYVPIIVQNPQTFREMSPLPDQLKRTVLRASTLIDTRGMREEYKALGYYREVAGTADVTDPENARMHLDLMWTLVNAQNILVASMGDRFDKAEQTMKAFRAKNWYVWSKPWECTYIDGCIRAARGHRAAAKAYFFTAEEVSNGASLQGWWTTALYASDSNRYLKYAIEHLTEYINSSARTHPTCRADLATLLVIAKRYQEAATVIEETLEFSPLTGPVAVAKLILCEATDAFDKAEECRIQMSHYSFHFAGLDGLILGRSGDEQAARSVLESMEQAGGVTAFTLALACLGIGDHDRAVELLRRAAFEQRDPYTIWLHIYPPLRHLYGHSGFVKLLADLNLERRG
ncbi:MAG: hypothetical protein K2X03_11045 [Bryobacteraceae bacterium]|nr:hypothetical protein [Bryobacteraceae bacterium]